MKTIILCILLSITGSTLYSQIVLTGSTTTSANTTYNIGTPNNTQVFNADAGTNIYSDNPWTLGSPIPFTQHRIYRVNGVWKLDKVFVGANGPSITPISTSAGNNANPPCDWGSGITLTGTCYNSTVMATTLTPTYVAIPQLTATAISAIAIPQKGMLIFDATNNCLKIYDGTAWKCLVTQ